MDRPVYSEPAEDRAVERPRVQPSIKPGTPEPTLGDKLRVLNASLGTTQQRVLAQQQQLEALRRQIEEYRLIVNRVKDESVETARAQAAPAPAPVPAPAVPVTLEAEPPRVAVRAEAPAPVPVPEPAPLADLPSPVVPGPAVVGPLPSLDIAAVASAPAPRAAARPRHPWVSFAPYAVVAGLALGLQIGSVARQPSIPTLRVAEVPPPSSPVRTTLTDEEADLGALSLVYAFVPPGGTTSVREILGPELDAPTVESPWAMQRVDENTVLVSYRPYGDVLENGPLYEFTVDVKTKAVQATGETVANLRAGALASAR